MRVQHHAQDTIDAEPRMPEAGVGGVHAANITDWSHNEIEM